MKKRLIAYYLPQFHSIKENDLWWGKGYTEWTAINNWQPYFKNHGLRKPAGLGYYNLLEPGIIQKQYDLASKYGVEGFCIWNYWFGNGEKLLETPIRTLLETKNSVKYCIAWANHDWFDKSRWLLLKKQNYLGRKDYVNYFYSMLPHLKNPNYIKSGNSPLVSIFMPHHIPDLDVFINTWNELSRVEGFDGIYFISDNYQKDFKYNHLFSAISHSAALFTNRTILQKVIERLVRYHNWTFLGPIRYSFPKIISGIYQEIYKMEKFIPTIFSGWDTTPRHKKRGVVLTDFNEVTFSKHVKEVFSLETKNEFIFIKSWNEWAEGNLLEPDDIFGEHILNVLKDCNS